MGVSRSHPVILLSRDHRMKGSKDAGIMAYKDWINEALTNAAAYAVGTDEQDTRILLSYCKNGVPKNTALLPN